VAAAALRSATSPATATLEIVLTTFDHGVDVYTVPGSGSGCAALGHRPREPSSATAMGTATAP
jgi:hypothetical protein